MESGWYMPGRGSGSVWHRFRRRSRPSWLTVSYVGATPTYSRASALAAYNSRSCRGGSNASRPVNVWPGCLQNKIARRSARNPVSCSTVIGSATNGPNTQKLVRALSCAARATVDAVSQNMVILKGVDFAVGRNQSAGTGILMDIAICNPYD
jgi:hypothetical protein